MIPRIAVAGAGNVASALAPAIEQAGVGRIIQVFSRKIDNARRLASQLKEATVTDNPEEIDTDADFCLISVADDAVEPLAGCLRRGKAVLLHTSGSVPAGVLATAAENYGVFYPLQTFTKGVEVDLSSVTLFTEGSDPATEERINGMARKVFSRVLHADSTTRRQIHLAAVFACNFANYMWMAASDILAQRQIPFDVLQPLISETLRKATATSPEAGQTGPAVRGDTAVIEKHKQMLSPEFRDIYGLLTDSIMKKFHK